MVLLTPALSVYRKLYGKDQIATPEDKYDSSSLQSQLWRNDELSEYQQESQLSLTKVSILQTHLLAWSKCLQIYHYYLEYALTYVGI